MLRRMRLLRTPSARRSVRIFAAKQVAAINAALTKRARVAQASAAAPGAGQATAAPAVDSASQPDSFAADASYASLVDMLLAQVEGVVAGYNAARSTTGAAGGAAGSTGAADADAHHTYDHSRPATLLDVLELNYDGDAFDIAQAADAGMGRDWLPSPLTAGSKLANAVGAAGGGGGGGGGGVGAGRGPRRRGDSSSPSHADGAAGAGADAAGVYPPGSHAILGGSTAARQPQQQQNQRFSRFAELHAQLEEALQEHSAAASAAEDDVAAERHGPAAAADAAAFAVSPSDAADESLPVPVPALGGRMPSGSRDLESWVRLSAAGRCTAAVVAKELAAGASAAADAGTAGAGHAAGSDDSQLLSLPAGPPGSRVRLWVAHTTWADYLELLRLWKVYDLALDHAAVAATHPASAAGGLLFGERIVGGVSSSTHQIHTGSASKGGGGSSKGASGGRSSGGRFRASFSSYPGFVTSTDDWYQLSSGLLVTETTTSAVDARVLKHIHPAHGLPTWLRVGVANMMAGDGRAWADAFARYNGGTYNCMWLVLDARKAWAALAAKSGSGLDDLPNGSLLVVEQSPLRVLAVDGTPTLRATGLWVSANRPSLAAVRKDLAYPEELPPALPHRIAAALGGGSGGGGQAGTAAVGGSTGGTEALKHVLAGAIADGGLSDDQRATVEAEAEADETVARLTAEVLVSATRHNEALVSLPAVHAGMQREHGNSHSRGVVVTADEERFAAAGSGMSASAATAGAARSRAAGKGSAKLQGKAKSKGKATARGSSLSRFRALEGAASTAAADANAAAGLGTASLAQAEAQTQSQSQSQSGLQGLFEPSLLHFLSRAATAGTRAGASIGGSSGGDVDGEESPAGAADSAAVLMAPRSKGGEALLLNPLLADATPGSDSHQQRQASHGSASAAATALGGAARRRASAALARFREMGGVSADAVVRGAAAAAAGADISALQASEAAAAASGSAASAKDAMRFRQSSGDSSSASNVGAPNGRERSDATHSGSSTKAASSTATTGAAYFSAFNNPRSRILQREAAAIQSAGDVGRLIRLNRWQGDPESQGRPYLAVAARFDLAPASDRARAANGAVDGKVASLGDILALQTALTLGPSTDHGQQPPFDWLRYDGPGYCDSAAPAASPRNCATMRAAAAGAGGAGAAGKGKGAGTSRSNAKPIVDVRSLCTPDSDASAPAAPSSGGESATGGTCPVALPCRWTWGWGHVSA